MSWANLWHRAGRYELPQGSTDVPSLWPPGSPLHFPGRRLFQMLDRSSGARAFPAYTVFCSVSGSVHPLPGSVRTPERSSKAEDINITVSFICKFTFILILYRFFLQSDISPPIPKSMILIIYYSTIVKLSSHWLQNPLMPCILCVSSESVSIHLPVESLLVVLSWTGHLSEQLSFALRDSLIHTVQFEPSPVINYTFWTCRWAEIPTKTLAH